ncbi:MAG: glycosyltransferase family A protein [Eubacteriales bacterium]|nr:glycosyltransferase family A protein [Eubacteriales bacterium]
MNWKKHTFVICAYGESPYLEACIQSLKKQTLRSKILIATSTPNAQIEKMAETYHLKLFVNPEPSQIARDWNFALSVAETPYVTLAHQDDLYFPDYTEQICRAAAKSRRPLIFFTDYYEIREGKTVRKNRLLQVKRLLLVPLRFRLLQKSPWVRRRVLSFGSSICCPSVTFAMEQLPMPLFREGYRCNVDWDAWERISREKGQFVYVNRPLMAHRIHPDSETTHTITETGRGQEDFFMFRRFWPEKAAALIEKFYASSEKSNDL